MKRRILSLAAVLALCLAVLPAAALAAEADFAALGGELNLTAVTEATVWKDGEEVKIEYAPGDAGAAPTLTLHDAALDRLMYAGELAVAAEGACTVASMEGDTAPTVTVREDSSLNSFVTVTGADGKKQYYVYGTALNPAPITIGEGESLTVKPGARMLVNTFVNNSESVALEGGTLALEDGSTLEVSYGAVLAIGADATVSNGGAIENAGTVVLKGFAEGTDVPAYIQNTLKFTPDSTGGVQTQDGGGNVTGNYDAQGGAIIAPLEGALDLTAAGDTNAAAVYGYRWDSANQILTLYEGFDANGQRITLPNNKVEIKAAEDQEAALYAAITGASAVTFSQGGRLAVPEGKSLTLSGIAAATNQAALEIKGAMTVYGGLNNAGTIANNGTLTVRDGLTNIGTIANNGVLTLDKTFASQAEAEAYIEALDLTGAGTVKAKVTEDGSPVSKDFHNSGTAFSVLDLSYKAADEETGGYKWEVTPDPSGSGAIISGKLTLRGDYDTLVLPDAAVEIVTEGSHTVGTLETPNILAGSSPDINLTFSGAGTLAFENRLALSGNNPNTLTVAQGAHVIARHGVEVSAGAVDGTVTVNGILEAAGDGIYAAVYTGRADVGPAGRLKISGEQGVTLCGTRPDGGATSYANLFTVAQGGRFEADGTCTQYVVQVAGATNFTLGDGADRAFESVAGTLPPDCAVSVGANVVNLIVKGSSPEVIYKGPITIPAASGGGGGGSSHSHTWSSEWSFDESRHWHACRGCSQRRDLADHAYDDEWDAVCSVCGYEREVPHRHAWSEEWTYDGTHHWHECTAPECDAAEDSQKDGYAPHAYDDEWDKTCNVCGCEREVPHRHAWSEEWAYDESRHWHECTAPECDAAEDSQKDGYAAHEYDNGRDAVCNVCGYRRKVPSSSGGGSGVLSGGGGAAVPSYQIVVKPPEHGRVVSSHSWANEGSTVTLRAAPDTGYELEGLTAVLSGGGEVKLTARGGGAYTFSMPGASVRVEASFRAEAASQPTAPAEPAAQAEEWSNPYTDVAEGAWYYEAVRYVTQRGLMGGFGAGRFGPDRPLTRGQLVQILYNREGRPAAEAAAAFRDVAEGGWCFAAASWAYSRGIAGGSGGLFRPSDPITREQLAVMLWRYAGKPAAPGRAAFPDAGEIGAYAGEAVNWAAQSGVLSGYKDGFLRPKASATRAQAAQILSGFFQEG